jgi:hypothetical protein
MTIEISFHTFADIGEFEEFACCYLDNLLENATIENGGILSMDADEIARLDDDDSPFYYSSAVISKYRTIQALLIRKGEEYYGEEMWGIEIQSDYLIEI